MSFASETYKEIQRDIREQRRREAAYLASTVPYSREVIQAKEEIRQFRIEGKHVGSAIPCYITLNGKYYHKKFGCHRATILCDENALPRELGPCKSCCRDNKTDDYANTVRKPFNSLTGEPQSYSLPDCMDIIGRCWNGWEPSPQGAVDITVNEKTRCLFMKDVFGPLNDLDYYCTRQGYKFGYYGPDREGCTRVVTRDFHMLYEDGHVVTIHRGDIIHNLCGTRRVVRVSGLLDRLATYGYDFVPDDLIEIEQATKPEQGEYWQDRELRGNWEKRGRWQDEEEGYSRRRWQWGNWSECLQMMKSIATPITKSGDIVCIICEMPSSELPTLDCPRGGGLKRGRLGYFDA